MQVTLAVLVSGWAHVLHAVYKPWGAGSAMYALQHGSLFVTSFVFLMGLLFKVWHGGPSVTVGGTPLPMRTHASHSSCCSVSLLFTV